MLLRDPATYSFNLVNHHNEIQSKLNVHGGKKRPPSLNKERSACEMMFYFIGALIVYDVSGGGIYFRPGVPPPPFNTTEDQCCANIASEVGHN